MLLATFLLLGASPASGFSGFQASRRWVDNSSPTPRRPGPSGAWGERSLAAAPKPLTRWRKRAGGRSPQVALFAADSSSVSVASAAAGSDDDALPFFEVGMEDEAVLLEYYEKKTGSKARVGGEASLTIEDLKAVSEVAAMLERGELEAAELEAVWADVLAGGEVCADAGKFVDVWRGLEDLFEYDDIEDDDEEGALASSSGPASGYEADWLRCASADGAMPESVGKELVLLLPFVAEPMLDGDLEEREVETLWAECVGSSESEADERAFERFWNAVDELFEVEGDGEEEGEEALDAEGAFEGERPDEFTLMDGDAEAVEAAEAAAAPEATTEEEEEEYEEEEEEYEERVGEEEAASDVLEGLALEDWECVGGPGLGLVSKELVLSKAPFVVEPLEDGLLTSEEADVLWAKTVGSGGADASAFGRFFAAVDDLFEEDDDEGGGYQDEDDDEEGYEDEDYEEWDEAALLESFAASRQALVEALGRVERAGLGAEDAVKQEVNDLVEKVIEHPLQEFLREEIGPDDVRLFGDWELAYTSSASFEFNEGYTGVAKTTPGGATFESLTQRLTATRLGKGDDLVVGDTSLVETLRLGANLGAASEAVKDNAPPLIVNIDGSWEMKRRVNLMSLDQDPKVIVNVVAQSLRYALIEVMGKRVEVGWKAMRVLNGAELRALDPPTPNGRSAKGDLRIMYGSAGKSSIFVFRRL